jgi:hydrophobe/amphiphile efflux-1 (HAE1) family protein
MSLSDISVKNPVFAWMLMLGLMIFGYISFSRMGVSQLPDVDFPVVNISVVYEGAAPEVMELDVVDAIESAVVGVEGVKSVTSTARLGSANISVEFGLEKNIDVAVSEIEAKINQAARNLPDDIERPVVTKVNPDDRPIMWLGVTSEKMDRKALMAYVRDQLKDRIQTVPGVADVFLGGYVDPNLRVWVDTKKLDRFQMTVTDVIGAIQSEHQEAPSGFIEDPTRERNVRTLGEASNVAEFKKIPLIRRGGVSNFSPIFLGEVADVEDGLADVRRISRVNGKNAVGMGVRKQRGSNTVAVADGVKKKMAQIQKMLPEGTEIGINFDSTQFIEESIHELIFTIGMSALFTAIVCWLFLGSFAATLNIVLAIPTSILGAFIFLKWFGFTLNTFSLLGLSLAIGIVVDDAIMVLENIYRHYSEKKTRKQASLDGANQITFAAIATTVAIIAIFIPVALMDGIIGKYFYQFGMTISVAVALSTVEALTLTPMRCSQFMEPPGRSSKIGHFMDSIFDKLMSSYLRALDWVLRHRAITLVVAGIFFLGSFSLLTKIPREFVPAQDTGIFLMRAKTPEGSSLEYTDKFVSQIEEALKDKPEVFRYFVAVGGFGGNESNTANLFVTLKPTEQRPIDPRTGKHFYMQDLLADYRKEFKTLKGGVVFVQDTSQGGFSASGRGFPVEFTLIGPEWTGLVPATKAIMKEMQDSGIYTDVDTDYKEAVMEVHIIPNRDAAKKYGVSVDEIGRTINALVGGLVVGKFSKDGHRNDIRVKMADVSADETETLKKIFVRNTRGELIRLTEVVTIVEKPGATSVVRRNRSRAINIFAGVSEGKSQGEALELVKGITAKHLPEGYTLVESGSAETFKESFQSLMIALLLGILIAYMVLGSQFNSFLDPVVVLTAMPFGFSGAFIALWSLGLSLNIYSMIGLILLMGIVKKNSILLVDFTKQKRADGLKIDEALRDACPKRLRPILMTAFSTTAGALPPALALGPGAEALGPMAWAIIGGNVVSTFLTLFVVPALYSVAARETKSEEEDVDVSASPKLSAKRV